MSTDYFMVCETHKRCVHIADYGFHGPHVYSDEADCMRALKAFIEEHRTCDDVRFVSEFFISRSYQRYEWNSVTVPGLRA